MLNPLFFLGFTPAQTMWEAQLKLLRIFTGAFDQPERAKEEGGAADEFRTAAGEESTVRNKTASKKRALERTGKATAKRTMRLSPSAKRSRRKGR
jgi:hypothetical protein